MKIQQVLMKTIDPKCNKELKKGLRNPRDAGVLLLEPVMIVSRQ